MKGKLYMGLAIAALLFAGCEKGDEGRRGDDGEVYPVSFTLAGVVPTRADGATTVPEGTELTVAAYDPNTRKLVAAKSYKMVSGGLQLDESGNDGMYLSVGTYDFCAMTPRQDLTGSGKDGNHGSVGQGVDALGSVTRAQVQANASTAISLDNLDHVASQISFTVQVVRQKVDSVASFAVQSIEVEGMVKAVADNYLLPENSLVIPEAGSADSFEALTIGGNNTDAFNVGEKGSGTGPGYINTQKTPLIVFPKAESTFNAVITVKVKKAEKAQDGTSREGAEETIKLNAKVNRLAFDPGKRYNFAVNYGWDYVRFDIIITDWTTVTDNSSTGSGEKTVSHTIPIGGWNEDINLDMTI